MADKLILMIAVLTLWLNGLLYAAGAREEYEGYVQEIKTTFKEEMEKELALHAYGGTDHMDNTIEALGINFMARRRATIEEARALVLLVIDRFVRAINDHEKIQPYLAERPFTHKRVSISIRFKNQNGESYVDGSVASIFFGSDLSTSKYRNHLSYEAEDPIIERSILFRRESYEEAVKLNAASPIENPALHQTTDKEEVIDRTLELFKHKMAAEYGLSCWSIGGRMAKEIKDIAVRMTGFRPAQKEDTRQLLVEVTEKLLIAINGNEKLRPYLAEYPFPMDRLRVLICFRTEGYSCYYDGISMEDVKLQRGRSPIFNPPISQRRVTKWFFHAQKMLGRKLIKRQSG